MAKAKTQFRVSSVISKLKLTETLPLPNNFFKHISHHTLAQIFSLILIFHIPISLFHQSQSMCLFPTHYVFPMLPPLLLHSSFLLFNSHHSPTTIHLSLPTNRTSKRKWSSLPILCPHSKPRASPAPSLSHPRIQPFFVHTWAFLLSLYLYTIYVHREESRVLFLCCDLSLKRETLWLSLSKFWGLFSTVKGFSVLHS